MPLDKIRETAKKKVMGFMASEQAMKLMGDPRVQKAMMNALTLQMKVRTQWNTAVSSAARTFNLATREDVRKLKREIKGLERQVKKLSD